MGSNDLGELAVLGGQAAHEQVEEEGSAQEAAWALTPDFIRSLTRQYEGILGSAFLDNLTELLPFMMFVFTSGLPFKLGVAWPDGPSGGFEVEVHYDSRAWEDLSPEAAVKLLAIELGLDSAEVQPDSERPRLTVYRARGTLRIPATYIDRGGAFRIVERALRKLGHAHEDETRRARLIEWASQLEA